MFWSPTRGGGTTVIDSFEDNDIAEYGGDTTNYSVRDENNESFSAKDGSYILKYADSGVGAGAINDTGDLSFPSQGDTFRFWCRNTDNSNVFMKAGFGTQNEDGESNMSGYYVGITNSKIEISRFDTGSRTELNEQGTASVSTGSWYEIEIEWTTGNKITATLLSDDSDNSYSTSATDSTYTSGGVGWWISHGVAATAFVDYYRTV